MSITSRLSHPVPACLTAGPRKVLACCTIYYSESGYIARDGYLQACTYAHELQRHHVDRVTSYIVGQDPKVNNSSKLVWENFAVGIIGPRHIDSLDGSVKLKV